MSKVKSHSQRVVLCHGVFDVFHIGHLRHLQAAKGYGQTLIVSVTSDKFVFKGPDRPRFNIKDRIEILSSLSLVSMAVESDHPDALWHIEFYRPDFYVKGEDYADLDADKTGNIKREKEMVERFGGQLVFTKKIGSSSELIRGGHLEGMPRLRPD